MLALTKFCFLAVVLPLFCMAAYAQSTNRNESTNCKAITPGYSVVCSGRQLEPESNFSPTVTFVCYSPGIFALLTHEPVSTDSPLRDVTLLHHDGLNWFRITEQWLVVSATQSAIQTIHRGTNSAYYGWILSLMGRLRTPSTSVFGFEIENGVTKGIFELDYLDAELIEQILPNCG